jgi:hypothetical protein
VGAFVFGSFLKLNHSWLECVLKGELNMKRFSVIFALSMIGCGSRSEDMGQVTGTCTTTSITVGGCYTSVGVFAELGRNPCQDAVKHPECSLSGMDTGVGFGCAWNPTTNECFIKDANGSAVCRKPRYTASNPYGSVNPGDMIATSSSRFAYKADSSQGTVCLPCSADFDGANCGGLTW